MEILRYILKDKKASDYFGVPARIKHSDRVEWFYGERGIGACTYPFHESDCFLRHLWSENDVVIMERSGGLADAVIKRKSREGGSMGGRSYGNNNVDSLIDYIEKKKRVHLFHTHIEPREPIPHMITFSDRPPTKELYQFQIVIPVEFEGDYIAGLLRAGKKRIRKFLKNSKS